MTYLQDISDHKINVQIVAIWVIRQSEEQLPSDLHGNSEVQVQQEKTKSQVPLS